MSQFISEDVTAHVQCRAITRCECTLYSRLIGRLSDGSLTDWTERETDCICRDRIEQTSIALSCSASLSIPWALKLPSSVSFYSSVIYSSSDSISSSSHMEYSVPTMEQKRKSMHSESSTIYRTNRKQRARLFSTRHVHCTLAAAYKHNLIKFTIASTCTD